MNFLKSKVVLKKINALHESAEAFNNTSSKLERDLLLHYLRELYEIIAEDNSLIADADLNAANQQSIDRLAASKDTISRTPRSEKNISATTPRAEKKESGHTLIEPALSEDIHPSVIPESQAEISVTASESPDLPSDPGIKPEASDELEELFMLSGKNDISSRFSRLPIADIAKSMGINDRILTINELFGGDQVAFSECVRKLNELTSFEEAKTALMDGPARLHQWSLPIKRSKADVFIKLVRRRYL